LWRPTETFTARVNVLRKQDTAQSWSQVTFDQVETVPNTGDAYFIRPLGSRGDLLDYAPLLSPGSNRLELYSVSLNWTPGAIDIHSASAWSRINNYNTADETQALGSYYPEWSNGALAAGLALYEQYVSLSKFSEELHVSSSSGRQVEWMLGGFYTRESGSDDQYTQAYDTAYQPIEFFYPSLAFSHQPSKFTEEVLFGNVTWHVTGRLDLGAGIRFSHDEQNFTYTSGAWNSPTSSFFGSGSETATSWMASARYRFNPSATVYGRVATGFQPGFPNGFYPGAPPTVSGETAINYELGLKAKYLESKALVDLSVFYVDWKDIQVGIAPDNVYYTANGAHATSRGFELSTSYAPIEALQLAYKAAYTECALDSTIPAANYYLTGYQIPDVPRWTMSATAAYSWPLAGLWRARLATDFRWFGQQWNAEGAVQSQQPGNYPAVIIPSYWVIDTNAQVSKGPLTLRFFVRNLTDERASLNRFAMLAPSSVPSQIVSKLLQPRTVGVGVSYNF
jgi:iron complex outermembrane recepter protein